MESVQVNITEVDIEEGIAKSCSECPAARAIRRALKKQGYLFSSVLVNKFEVSMDLSWAFKHSALFVVSAPEVLHDFVGKFDAGEPVKPISFALCF